jgi:hypothetical protein
VGLSARRAGARGGCRARRARQHRRGRPGRRLPQDGGRIRCSAGEPGAGIGPRGVTVGFGWPRSASSDRGRCHRRPTSAYVKPETSGSTGAAGESKLLRSAKRRSHGVAGGLRPGLLWRCHVRPPWFPVRRCCSRAIAGRPHAVCRRSRQRRRAIRPRRTKTSHQAASAKSGSRHRPSRSCYGHKTACGKPRREKGKPTIGWKVITLSFILCTTLLTSQTYTSPDRAISADVVIAGPTDCESKVAIRDHQRTLVEVSYISADHDHGQCVNVAKWSRDSQFFCVQPGQYRRPPGLARLHHGFFQSEGPVIVARSLYPRPDNQHPVQAVRRSFHRIRDHQYSSG